MELAHPHLHLYPQVKPNAEKHSGPKIKRKFLILVQQDRDLNPNLPKASRNPAR